MTSTTFSDQILKVSSASTTAWLPLSTPWPKITQCSTLVYIGSGKDAGKAFGWDVLYGKSLDTGSPQCLPLEVWSWWFESTSVATPTLLGPTFECPQAYTTGSTSAISPGVTEVFCCPSDYDFATAIPSHTPGNDYPSQCFSTLTAGDVLRYQTNTGGIYQPTTLTVSDTFSVHGQHVNGFNIDAKVFSSMSNPTTTSFATTVASSMASSSTSKSSSSSLTAPESASPSTSSSPPTTSSKTNTHSVAIGVGVAVAIVVVASAAAAIFFLLRRRKRSPAQGIALGGYHDTADINKGMYVNSGEIVMGRPSAPEELSAVTETTVGELHAEPKSRGQGGGRRVYEM